MKSGKRNFLEPSGPLQACNGTALPFYLLLTGFAQLQFFLCEISSIWSDGIGNLGLIPGFSREVDENCVFISYYAASNVNLLQTFRTV